MEHIDLAPIAKVAGTVALPGSKSISNRTLLLAALCAGQTTVRGLLASDDTQRMLEALDALGVKVEQLLDENGADSRDFIVHGCAGNFPNKNADLFLGNAGTAFRPLTAALALSNGSYHLHGVARMHERPIGDLVDALRQAGSQIDYLGNEGFPPLQIKPSLIKPGAAAADRVQVKGNVSSQFLTGLLMSLPLTNRDMTVEVVGELISKPYIEITLNLMAKFGLKVEKKSWNEFFIPAGQVYQSPGEIFVEGDASSASYFLAAGAIGGGDAVRVTGVGSESIQGDKRFAETLEQMGAQITWGPNWIEAAPPADGQLKAIDVDLNHIPDAAMTIAIAALFAKGKTTIRNIESWRVKETDRLSAMATELRKVGATVEEGQDWISVIAPESLTPNAEIDTYDDHRMAMCFSLVALGGVPVRINDPKCTAKTFPTYFEELARITL
ncbi:3-phosphoshikimate 1-carboxyvinyltransferase [Chitinibacter bivalviorum]|uniref:3-phosphoshikimate 1-carboxyvinyltransferase n=1 Tax=Chitinibacter bivalviorum TaxID=2739434 RepID=A0A7H9BIM8_9NEIS|nr:3-phosphoshikimate 1-carboxyvinyltransferase [Chitinibacter bivalviorum]QLG88495.1 3-phosphoshikimate 1-carboxyvinyltransferase [Chitinibacter bivalviorum]